MSGMNVETLLALAQGALDEGNVRASCDFYEMALHMKPDNVETLEAYAEVMTHYAHDLDRAKQLLLHAVQVAPDEGHVKYLNLAQLSTGHAAMGFYQHALRVATTAHAKTPNFGTKKDISSIYCAMAELYLTDLCDDEDAPQQCDALLAEAAKHCDRNVELYSTRASLFLSLEKPDVALQDLKTAVDLCKQLPEEEMPTYESQIELGKLLMQVCPDEAFHFLLVVLNTDDTNPYVWFLLGETARLRKRFNDSARLLKRAREILVVANGDEGNLANVDEAIRMLVDDMGGADAVAKVPNMDHPNPISLLEDSDWEDDEDDEDDGAAKAVEDD